MRLDHLLSKRVSKGLHFYLVSFKEINKSGGDTRGGNTRSHPEHDGQAPYGRWYYAGDGMEEQVAAGLFYKRAHSSAG